MTGEAKEYQIEYWITTANNQKHMGSDVRFDCEGALKCAKKWLLQGYNVKIELK